MISFTLRRSKSNLFQFFITKNSLKFSVHTPPMWSPSTPRRRSKIILIRFFIMKKFLLLRTKMVNCMFLTQSNTTSVTFVTSCLFWLSTPYYEENFGEHKKIKSNSLLSFSFFFFFFFFIFWMLPRDLRITYENW